MVDLNKAAIEYGYSGIDDIVLTVLKYQRQSRFIHKVFTGEGDRIFISAIGNLLAFTQDGNVYKSKHLHGLSTDFQITLTNIEQTITKIAQTQPDKIHFDPSEWSVENLETRYISELPRGKYLGATLNGLTRDKFSIEDYLGLEVAIDFRFEDGIFQSKQIIGSVSRNNRHAEYVRQFRAALTPKFLGKYEEGQYYLVCELNGDTIHHKSNTFTSRQESQIDPELATEALKTFLFEEIKSPDDTEPERLLLIHSHSGIKPTSPNDIFIAQDLKQQMGIPVEVIAVAPFNDFYFLYTGN